MKNILVTGSNGFIGKNLLLRLKETGSFNLLEFNRYTDKKLLPELVRQSDVIFHLAGENRPLDDSSYEEVNVGLTQNICDLVVLSKQVKQFIYTSSIHAEKSNPYGASKRKAEEVVKSTFSKTDVSAYIYRLPNVFGKWCRPNYNSAVATFCNNVAKGIPLSVNTTKEKIILVYIDDVVADFVNIIDKPGIGVFSTSVSPIYKATPGELASIIESFKSARLTNIMPKVGSGLVRALYSTYLSYLESTEFSYDLLSHKDARGIFAEILKTEDSGQFSVFTVLPGQSRGGHYHHTKTEKFLVVKGKARFDFRCLNNGGEFTLEVSEDVLKVVDTIPGWAHSITNIGDEEVVVLLWANEVFDPEKPDTIFSEI